MTSDAVLEEDRVGVGRRRAVRAFGEDPGADRAGVRGRDLALQGGEHEDVHVEPEEVLVVDRLGAGRAGEGARSCMTRAQEGHVEAVLAVDAAADVGDRDDAHAGLWRSRAVASPTLPKPCTATVAPASGIPRRRAAASSIV